MKIKKIQDLKEKGITLIALVVTIIILLILAGVTLNMALSGDGLFNMARKAATDYNQKSVEEKLQILYAEKIMEDVDKSSNVKTDVTDVLEEMTGGEITKENIEEFNKLLEQYGEEVKGITTAEDLALIGTDENYPIDGVYVQLSDIEEELTTQIGSEANPFKGIYNGNGKRIKNLNLTSEVEYTGMFRVNEGTIKNVKIENCEISSTERHVGGIVGQNAGIIENCTILNGEVKSEKIKPTESNFSDENASMIGGICGSVEKEGIIKKCENSANITGLSEGVGGICGVCTSEVYNCTNKGNIKGPFRVGGICGWSWGYDAKRAIIEDCVNYGEVDASMEDTSTTCFCGGIVGSARAISIINNCKNCGNVIAIRQSVGGISGVVYERCYYYEFG